MSYTEVTGITVQDGESAVKLDTGDIIAVKCTRSVKGSRIYFTATARAIDSSGSSIKDPNGSEITRTVSHSDTDASRVPDVTRDCILLTLGEPPETLTFGAQYMLDVSIRQALALAAITTGTINAATTLSQEGS